MDLGIWAMFGITHSIVRDQISSSDPARLEAVQARRASPSRRIRRRPFSPSMGRPSASVNCTLLTRAWRKLSCTGSTTLSMICSQLQCFMFLVPTSSRNPGLSKNVVDGKRGPFFGRPHVSEHQSLGTHARGTSHAAAYSSASSFRWFSRHVSRIVPSTSNCQP